MLDRSRCLLACLFPGHLLMVIASGSGRMGLQKQVSCNCQLVFHNERSDLRFLFLTIVVGVP